ncbi:hypothetical protein DFH29DRAFT_891881, partial [Suillus ampliporus]
MGGRDWWQVVWILVCFLRLHAVHLHLHSGWKVSTCSLYEIYIVINRAYCRVAGMRCGTTRQSHSLFRMLRVL